MQQFQHDDVVHDVAFDFYGRRFVSVSSDKTIKVWDRDDHGHWAVSDGGDFKAHENSILRASWAHPEFGQVFASCSTDCTVRIWEEQEGAVGDGQKQSRWQSKAQLTDSKRSVNDVQFAPRYHGLKIATASADGSVRVYEANDVFSLSYWPMQDCFDAHPEEHGVTCLSWNSSVFEPPMLATGGAGNCKIWSYDDTGRKWNKIVELPSQHIAHDIKWAPNMGRSFHLVAVACRENDVQIHLLRRESGGNLSCEMTSRLTHDNAVWRCAWNVTGTILTTSDKNGAVTLWRRGFDGEWRRITEEAPRHEEAHAMY